MRSALNELAMLAPEWLKGVMKTEWVKRYGRRFDGYNLPKSKAKREALAIGFGEDGFFLFPLWVLVVSLYILIFNFLNETEVRL